MLAASIDVYVLDGLQAARDGGASVVELPRLIPARGVGYEIDAALDVFHDAISAPAPERYTFVLGGGGLRRLGLLARAVLGVCNDVVLGGAVANTFLVAQGWKPGASPYEPDAVDLARELLERARGAGVTVHLPIDAAVRTARTSGGATLDDRLLDRALQNHEAVADIGPETCIGYRNVLAKSATVLWVGMMGECSAPETQRGSLRVGMAAAEAARPLAVGRETVEAVRFFRLDTRFKVAPGGDAVISLLAGAPFPGLDAVSR
jgi:phosphoglycerate kinase